MMKRKTAFLKYAVLICLYINFYISAIANNFLPLQQLIERRIPELKNKVVFSEIKNTVKDTSSYYTKGTLLNINASTISAAAYALNNYLKKFCNSSFSETGDNIIIPSPLPQTGKTIIQSAFFPIRYALNYCTYNYSMSFWNWNDWEKELDRMALNGVNLMLAPIGTEEVWQKTLTEFGFSDTEIRNFIPGPAFNAWWLMGNLEGWGGPVSDNMIQYWTQLQKKILPRMKELGIEPIVQSFCGMVPSLLKKKYQNSNIADQGKWMGLFQRPAILMPQDSLFAKMSAVYYKYFKQLYGDSFKYLGGDLFHEGGKTAGLNLKELGSLIQDNMQKHFPRSTWVLQGWQDNPKPEMLKGLNRSQTLILDLLGDRSRNWEKRNSYDQFPWVWCTITNFGGKQYMEGKLLRVLTEPQRAAKSIAGSTIKGVGIIPEAIENNSIVYQWTLDGAWQREITPVQKRVEEFVKARYGANDKQLVEAWQYLLQSVYITHSTVQAGGYESIFCGRPDSALISTISCCGPANRIYDVEILFQAAMNFAAVAGKYQNNESFRFDLVDIWRQLINLKGREAYDAMMFSLKQKKLQNFQLNKNRFITLLTLQDKWTGTHPQFRVGSWINKAKDMLPGESDKKMAEWNARTQITYWGNDNPETDLHEYAAKEWNGILKDLYLQRWIRFFEWAEAKLEGRSIPYPDFFAMEKQWTLQTNPYSSDADGNMIAILPEIIKELKE